MAVSDCPATKDGHKCKYLRGHDGWHVAADNTRLRWPSEESMTVEDSHPMCDSIYFGSRCILRKGHDGLHSNDLREWHDLGADQTAGVVMPQDGPGSPSSIKEWLTHSFDFEATDEDAKQFMVMMEALKKFHERDEKHRGLWRYFGAIDSAHQARAKATRTYNVAIGLLKGQFEKGDVFGEVVNDDAIDMINYACFFVRNVEEGRYG